MIKIHTSPSHFPSPELINGNIGNGNTITLATFPIPHFRVFRVFRGLKNLPSLTMRREKMLPIPSVASDNFQFPIWNGERVAWQVGVMSSSGRFLVGVLSLSARMEF